MEIKKKNTVEVQLDKEDLKKAISLYLTHVGLNHTEITNIIDVTKGVYEPMGNTEGETIYYFDGVKVSANCD